MWASFFVCGNTNNVPETKEVTWSYYHNLNASIRGEKNCRRKQSKHQGKYIVPTILVAYSINCLLTRAVSVFQMATQRHRKEFWEPALLHLTLSLTSFSLVQRGILDNDRRWMCMHAHASVMSHSATPWIVAHQAPLSMGFSGKNTGIDCHALLQGIFPNQGIKPGTPALQVDSLPSEPPGKPM